MDGRRMRDALPQENKTCDAPEPIFENNFFNSYCICRTYQP